MNRKKNPELWEFKDVRILVVDEGSMVPVQLLHSVLKLLIQHAELRKFIILGEEQHLQSCLQSENHVWTKIRFIYL